MAINRFNLVELLTEGNINEEVYNELLALYYSILDEEDNKESFVSEVVLQSELSTFAMNALKQYAYET